MRPRSPASRQPLLRSPAEPGMSSQRHHGSTQRVSESSISSLMSSDARGQAAMYSSSSASGRSMGPTARLYSDNNSASSRSTPPVGNNYGPAGAAAAPLGFVDDDEDDALHTFTAAEKRDVDSSSKFNISSWRGWANALMLFFLLSAIVGIFAIYPIITFYVDSNPAHGGHTSGYNLGGVNSSGQYPMIPNLPQLIDPDTPEDVKTRTGFDGEQWNLVFSDEFNVDGRTFYPGDDPFWTAVDIHYWPTNDFEWLDPSAVTTEGGHLVITMNQQPINDLNLISGQIQSWNQLCFNKNAYFETSVSMPGKTDVGGFWPGVWTMGNLGRAGYGASNEGTWPYTYDSCDIGTLPNQTWPNGTGPEVALTTGGEGTGGTLSYLPGQKLSACTCPGEDHPGPDVSVGRAAPEIDMIEAQIRLSVEHGEVSQSNQLAPFDDSYEFCNTTRCVEMYDTDLTMWNTYKGGEYQQTVSALTLLPDRIYRDQVTGGRSGEFAMLGFEYSAYPEERERGYIHWTSDSKPSWTMYADAVGPNPRTQIGRRIVSEEPMYMILNLHASDNFQKVDWAHMDFPNYFRIDYMRVYQRADGSGSIGCDPEDMPTKDYIDRHIEAYTNPNLTTWAQTGAPWPKNRLVDQC